MQILPKSVALNAVRSEGHSSLPAGWTAAITSTLDNGVARIKTVQGEALLRPGDWLLQVEGGLLVLPPAAFDALFEVGASARGSLGAFPVPAGA